MDYFRFALLLLVLLVPQLAVNAKLPPTYNSTHALVSRLQTGDVFTNDGPIFLGFPPNSPNINAVKYAFLDAFMLARRALPEVTSQSSTYLRWFKKDKACRVASIFSYILGSGGKGPDAMRAPDWPLRVVYQDSSLIGVRPGDDDCELLPTLLAVFFNDPWDDLGPAILLCNYLFFAFDVEKLRLADWEVSDCDDLPDWMEPRLKTLGFVILHELTHWTAETQKATGSEEFPAMINDYGADGLKFANVPGDPSNGYGARNSYKLNLRSDLDSSLNADSYAWMAMEAWLKWKCPNKDIKNPPPVAPKADEKPADVVAGPKPG